MKGRRPLEVEEVNRLIETAKDHRERALFGVCFWTGARVSEALALDLDDVIEPYRDTWRIRAGIEFRRQTTKGRRSGRQVHVHETLSAYLHRYIDATRGLEPGPLFLASGSGRRREDHRLSRRQATRLFTAAFGRADIHTFVGTQSGRKTFAQRLHDAGTGIEHIQDGLGHRDVRHTRRYFETDRRKAAAAVASLPAGPPLPSR